MESIKRFETINIYQFHVNEYGFYLFRPDRIYFNESNILSDQRSKIKVILHAMHIKKSCYYVFMIPFMITSIFLFFSCDISK